LFQDFNFITEIGMDGLETGVEKTDGRVTCLLQRCEPTGKCMVVFAFALALSAMTMRGSERVLGLGMLLPHVKVKGSSRKQQFDFIGLNLASTLS
jgi:hypothetical protein